jgi:hypothetical protein
LLFCVAPSFESCICFLFIYKQYRFQIFLNTKQRLLSLSLSCNHIFYSLLFAKCYRLATRDHNAGPVCVLHNRRAVLHVVPLHQRSIVLSACFCCWCCFFVCLNLRRCCVVAQVCHTRSMCENGVCTEQPLDDRSACTNPAVRFVFVLQICRFVKLRCASIVGPMRGRQWTVYQGRVYSSLHLSFR